MIHWNVTITGSGFIGFVLLSVNIGGHLHISGSKAYQLQRIWQGAEFPDNW
jgi:hypothetical protein